MDNRNAPAFTVRQLSELFEKSEDTIRRWKNEGIGKGDDNIRLIAIENEDAFGRRTSRHLTFTRSAVRDFVRANPFLMDDAPLLREFMEQEEKSDGVIALPASIEAARGTIARGEEKKEAEDTPDGGRIHSGLLRRLIESFHEDEFDDEFEDEFGDEFEDAFSDSEPGPTPPPRDRRRPPFDREEKDPDSAEERQKRYDEAAMRYMLRLLHLREADCRSELGSIHQASTLFYRRRDIADALADGRDYVSGLVNQREEELERELDKIRKTTRALERILWETD